MSTRPLLLALAIALFVGLIYLVWWSLQPPSLQSYRLRTGARIKLSAVTVGTVHQFDPTPPLLRLAQFQKPPQKVQPFGLETAAQPEVRLWLGYRPAAPSPAPDDYPIYHRFEDEHGCPLDAGKAGFVRMVDGELWTSWRPSPALPLERPFSFCGYYRDTREEAFRFHIEPRLPSGKRVPRRALSPRALPQTVTANGLRVSLDAVREVRDPEPHYRAYVRGFDKSGRSIPAIWLDVDDASGGRSEPVDEEHRARLSGDGLPFWGLCRKEPAWELSAYLAGGPRTNTVPEARWDLPRIAVGGKNATQRLGARSLQAYALSERSAPGSKLRRVILWVEGIGFATPCRLAVTRINGEDASKVVAAAAKGGALPRKPVLEADFTPGVHWRVPFTFPVPERPAALSVQISDYSGKAARFVFAPPQPDPSR